VTIADQALLARFFRTTGRTCASLDRVLDALGWDPFTTQLAAATLLEGAGFRFSRGNVRAA
jgi:hypothetical protein